MSEHPILFSAPMVRAILEGCKTQTRRLCKLTPYQLSLWMANLHSHNPRVKVKCPYGEPGDWLWVKETHRPGTWRQDGRVAFDYAASPEMKNTPWRQCPDGELFEVLTAKWCAKLDKAGLTPDDDGYYHWEPGQVPLQWTPSIFMPRWASRINLDIVSVRVAQLCTISADDCIKEGVTSTLREYDAVIDLRDKYRVLWESINGPGSWEANPWVWVVEFKRVAQ